MYTVVLQWCIGLHYTAHDIHYNQVRIHSGGAQREPAPKTHGIFPRVKMNFCFCHHSLPVCITIHLYFFQVWNMVRASLRLVVSRFRRLLKAYLFD